MTHTMEFLPFFLSARPANAPCLSLLAFVLDSGINGIKNLTVQPTDD